jgi:hypothetical protein
MPRERFKIITRVMRFDSKDNREERRLRDKMAPIRKIHDKFATICRAAYKPFIRSSAVMSSLLFTMVDRSLNLFFSAQIAPIANGLLSKHPRHY